MRTNKGPITPRIEANTAYIHLTAHAFRRTAFAAITPFTLTRTAGKLFRLQCGATNTYCCVYLCVC